MSSRASSKTTQEPESFAVLRRELRALLRSAQNSDGGWAFHIGGESRVEPTCWAIRAVTDAQAEGSVCETLPENLARAVEFLRRKQRADGSWSPNDGMDAGGWVTSLACSVLA